MLYFTVLLQFIVIILDLLVATGYLDCCVEYVFVSDVSYFGDGYKTYPQHTATHKYRTLKYVGASEFMLLIKYHLGDKIKKNEMDGACSTYGRQERCVQGLVWKR